MTTTTPPSKETVQTNPANKPETAAIPAGRRKRISLALPRRKLEVPKIEGYRLYWFASRNVEAALAAWYEFVKADEVSLNQSSIASPVSTSGNTALGSNVEVLGGPTEDGKSFEKLHLMKIKLEYYNEDRKALADRNKQIVDNIFRRKQMLSKEGLTTDDAGTEYVQQAKMGTGLFNGMSKKSAR